MVVGGPVDLLRICHQIESARNLELSPFALPSNPQQVKFKVFCPNRFALSKLFPSPHLKTMGLLGELTLLLVGLGYHWVGWVGGAE